MKRAQIALIAIMVVTTVLAGLLYNYQQKVYQSMEWSFIMLRSINKEKIDESFENYVSSQEEEAFAEADSEVITLTSTKKHVFKWQDRSVIPVYAAHFKTSSASQPREVFERAVEMQKAGQSEASDLFSQVIRSRVKSPEEAWIRVAACLNLVEADPTDRLKCLQVLSYLHGSQNRFLTAAEIEFFKGEFVWMVPDAERLMARSDEAWDMANLLEQNLLSKKGPYRIGVEGQLCSVSTSGTIYVFPPRWMDEVQLRTHNIPVTNEEEPFLEIHSPMSDYPPVKGIHFTDPVFVSKPDTAEVVAARRSGYLTFGGLLVLMAALFAYTFKLMKRERSLVEAQTRFVATASHELRTPISVIQLHAETLALDRVFGEKRSQYETAILNEARRAGSLVENFLTLSSQRSAVSEKVETEELDLVPLVQEMIDPFSERVQISQDSVSELRVKCEHHRFAQILFNLIDNAVKYSEEVVLLELTEDGSVDVIDSGFGISESDREQVFEEFYRSDDRRVRAKRGSGIGLTVSRRLADELGISLTLEPNQPCGTRAVLKFQNA